MKTNMTLENQTFEDVCPICPTGDVTVCHDSFSEGGVHLQNSPDTSLQRQDTAMDWTIDFVELPGGFLAFSRSKRRVNNTYMAWMSRDGS